MMRCGWILVLGLLVAPSAALAEVETFHGGTFPTKGNMDPGVRAQLTETVMNALGDEGLIVGIRWNEKEADEYQGRIGSCSAPCRATLIDILNVKFAMGIGIWQRTNGGKVVLALTVWRVNGDRYEVARSWAPSASAEEAEREVRSLAAELRSRFDGRVARLRVTGGPEGMTVRVEDEPWGRAPVERQIEDPGLITVVLEAPGFAAKSYEIEVAEGHTVELEADLETAAAAEVEGAPHAVAAGGLGDSAPKKSKAWVTGPVLLGAAGAAGMIGVVLGATHQGCSMTGPMYGNCIEREEATRSGLIVGGVASAVAITGAIIWSVRGARRGR